MRISHPTLRLRIAAAACVASSPNMIDRANCSGCSCSVRLHHAALPSQARLSGNIGLAKGRLFAGAGVNIATVRLRQLWCIRHHSTYVVKNLFPPVTPPTLVQVSQ